VVVRVGNLTFNSNYKFHHSRRQMTPNKYTSTHIGSQSDIHKHQWCHKLLMTVDKVHDPKMLGAHWLLFSVAGPTVWNSLPSDN